MPSSSGTLTYGQRLDCILRSDAVVALPGGVGSLAEWTTAWASAQTEGRPRVLALIGSGWSSLMKCLREVLIASAEDFEWLALVDDIEELVPRIAAGLACRRDSMARG